MCLEQNVVFSNIRKGTQWHRIQELKQHRIIISDLEGSGLFAANEIKLLIGLDATAKLILPTIINHN